MNLLRSLPARSVLLLCVSSCGAGEAPKPEVPTTLPSTPQVAPKAADDTPSQARELKPELQLRVVAVGSGLGLRVINVGKERVSLAAKVILESKSGDDAKDSGLVLQTTCQSQGCVTLLPGSEIDAPAWLERVSGERCGTLLVPKTNGEQALRISSCGGSHSVSIPFIWPMQ